MTDEEADATIRRAMGGDADAITWVEARGAGDDVVLITVAALLEGRVEGLDRAEVIATSSRDRQLVAIARAHLRGEGELVDALARDHLVDFPDSLVVAWIASSSADRSLGPERG